MTDFGEAPGWVRDAVFYQIFPDRFARSGRVPAPGPLEPWDDEPTVNGFKGGDLYGIVEHLDHLVDLGITAIHTTAYRRTRGTAGPAAAGEGIPAVEYDPRDLPAFAAELLAAPGRHLVVGHSNTTPDLVRLLGGDPGTPIDEHEHDRVYLLVPTGDGIRTFLFRY